MSEFDEQALVEGLSMLPDKHRVAFAASCCERLVPNYRAFAVIEQWGNPDLLRQALDEIWRFLEGGPLPEARIRSLIQAITMAIPHTEDFSSVFVAAAGNAAAAVIYTLECCLDGDAQRAALMGRLTTDSVESYLRIVNGVPIVEAKSRHPTLTHETWLRQTLSFQQWIEQTAPLMVAELEQQRWDVEQLRICTDLTQEVLERLRRLSSMVGIQPFVRGIVKEPSTEKEVEPEAHM